MTSDHGRLEQLIDQYAQAWSAPDAAVRRRHLEAVWADGATYADPTAQVAGRDGLAAHLDLFHERMPGARIERTTRVDTYGQVARFGWRLLQEDGTEAIAGLDFVELADDGRISRIVGFFGPLA